MEQETSKVGPVYFVSFKHNLYADFYCTHTPV